MGFLSKHVEKQSRGCCPTDGPDENLGEQRGRRGKNNFTQACLGMGKFCVLILLQGTESSQSL